MWVRAALMLAATLIWSGADAGQAADATGRVSIQIGAQNLDSALRLLGRLEDLHIVFVSEDIANLKTPGLQGNFTDQEALQALLRGTGLTFRFLDARTVSIVPISPAADSHAALSPAAQIRGKAAEGDAGGDAAALAELTVTADRLLAENALKAAVYEFVNSYGGRYVVNAHLARWYEAVCPQTSGLSPDLNAFVSDRIREVAKTVGAPAGTEKDCKVPNVEIMFTTEPQKLMDEVAKKYQGLLGFPYQARVRRLTTVTRPIQSWYATATGTLPGTGPVNLASNWQLDHASKPDPSVRIGSRLPATLMTALVNVLVVADFSKVVNRRSESLADYIAILALSVYQPQYQPAAACNELPSVGQIMSSGCGTAPTTLTAADTAYLKGLYSADLTRPIQTAIAEIADRMFRDLSTQPGEAPLYFRRGFHFRRGNRCYLTD